MLTFWDSKLYSREISTQLLMIKGYCFTVRKEGKENHNHHHIFPFGNARPSLPFTRFSSSPSHNCWPACPPVYTCFLFRTPFCPLIYPSMHLNLQVHPPYPKPHPHILWPPLLTISIHYKSNVFITNKIGTLASDNNLGSMSTIWLN